MDLSGKLIENKYQVRSRIGKGSFGETYICENLDNKHNYAVKFENANTSVPRLFYEVKIYQTLNTSQNVPRVHNYGLFEDKNFMIMDLLGKSLEEVYNNQKRSFSLKTVVLLADQMLKCIEDVHKGGFLHRDIKPENFVIGTGSKRNRIYIIDFGLSKRYIDTQTGEHIPYRDDKSLTGTARYASVNALKGIEQSRRDDLESLGYVWLYFLRGSLPWQGFRDNDVKASYMKILEVKETTPFEVLCQGFPEQFVQYFYAVKKLEFTDAPNYKYLRDTILSILPDGNNPDNEIVFDWCKKETPKLVRLTKCIRPPPVPQRFESIRPKLTDNKRSESKGLIKNFEVHDSLAKTLTPKCRPIKTSENVRMMYSYDNQKREEYRGAKLPSVRYYSKNIEELMELNVNALRKRYISGKDGQRHRIQGELRRPKVTHLDLQTTTPRLHVKS